MEAAVYVVTQPLTCAAGRFGPGDVVYEPWLNGQAANLERIGLISSTHKTDKVPDVELAGVPDWDAHLRPAPPLPEPPEPPIAVAKAVQVVVDRLTELSPGERLALAERLMEDNAVPTSEAELVGKVASVADPVDELPDDITPTWMAGTTVAVILASANHQPARIGEMLEAEQLGKNRPSLVKNLHTLLDADTAPAPASKENK